MTDISSAPDAPDAAETAHFLRRFADLMANGNNAAYLLRAAVLLETLTASLSAASDEEQLWRYKYETMTHQHDLLEAECDSLKHDIEGHVSLSSTILGERDTLKATLEGRETELVDLNTALSRERERTAAGSKAHETALAELLGAFEQERAARNATADAKAAEIDQLRRDLEREGAQAEARLDARDAELSELRAVSARERDELLSRLDARAHELAALRADFARDTEVLQNKISVLETGRAELRSAFERISELRAQATEPTADAARAAPDSVVEAERAEATLVPKATLRQARAQFEYLAGECTRRGDVPTQVMCELGAYTMELALGAAERTPLHQPVSEVARDILAPAG